MEIIQKSINETSHYPIAAYLHGNNATWIISRAKSKLRYMKSFFNENVNTSPVSELVNHVFRFKELPQDWDSYGAEKISIDSIVTAIQIIKFFESSSLEIEYAFPMRDGGVQLEMGFKNYNIEFEIYNENHLNVLIFDNYDNLKSEKKYNTTNIQNLLSDLNSYSEYN